MRINSILYAFILEFECIQIFIPYPMNFYRVAMCNFADACAEDKDL